MLKRSCRNSPIVLIALLLIAAAPPKPFSLEKGKREPIVVTSNRMEANQLGDIVTFIGEVTLKKEAMTINTDRLTVFYDPPAKGVRQIEALGNVVVRQEGRVALANKAVYFSNEEKIVLTENARVIENENENEVGGDRITLFLRDNRSIIEGGKVLFYQERKAEAPAMKLPRRSGK
jgi:lipopolysaccharide export system protein LptA